MGYTTLQFHAYLQRAQRRERQAIRWQILAGALAMAEGKAVQSALDQLGDDE